MPLYHCLFKQYHRHDKDIGVETRLNPVDTGQCQVLVI